MKGGADVEPAFRGVYPILVTPFDERGRIDEESLARLVDWNVQSGVHGIGIALGSEIFRLTEAERDLVTRIVVEQARGRVPVVVNTTGSGTDLAIHYGQHAKNLGANALMISPPAAGGPSEDEIYQYYADIAEAAEMPIFMQDVGGTPVPPELAARLVEASPWLQWIKVEVSPMPERVAATLAAGKGRLTVFGGAGGNYFIEELRRGSSGTMPSCSIPEIFVAAWDLFQAGKADEAEAYFTAKAMPLLLFCSRGPRYFYHTHKQILVRRGIIRTAYVRRPTTTLDVADVAELDRILADMGLD